MKLPAFVGTALSAVKTVAAKLAPVFSGVAGLARRAGTAAAGLSARAASRVDRKALKLTALIAAAVTALAVVAVLIGVVIAGAGSRRDREAGTIAGVSRAGIPGGGDRTSGMAAADGLAGDGPIAGNGELAVPRAGPALAAMLLIPGEGEWPWPLALEPKARYTEADAAAVRPDLGEVDVSELTRRRKAELEAIFGAVD